MLRENTPCLIRPLELKKSNKRGSSKDPAGVVCRDECVQDTHPQNRIEMVCPIRMWRGVHLAVSGLNLEIDFS